MLQYLVNEGSGEDNLGVAVREKGVAIACTFDHDMELGFTVRWDRDWG